jgi:ABC-type amino acid transport substrate-binding protein
MAMKRIARNPSFLLGALMICFIATLFLSPLMVSAQETYRGEGKDQLVDALDAAFVRVLESGQYRTIMNSDPFIAPIWVNVADCYPNVDETPFPAEPKGLLANIINTKTIRVGTYEGGSSGQQTLFENVNPQILRKIIDELGIAYGIPPDPDPDAIQIEWVYLTTPSSRLLFESLNSGEFDITYLNAALGANVSVGTPSVSKRRRNVARFTCTISSTPWLMWVKDDSPYTSVDDLMADTDAQMCVGQLSSRLSRAYFNDGQVANLVFEDDINVCTAGLLDGTYDVYFHFDPNPPAGIRAIDMKIIAGVPIWVAGEQSCEGLDVCEGDVDRDGDVDVNDVIKFLKDFVRSIRFNDCPACVQGW